MNKLNDLTISLLAIGLVLILLVILFNWWQERKIRKAAVKQFTATSHDILMDDFALDVPQESSVLIESSTKIKDVIDRYDAEDVYLPDEIEFKIDLANIDHDPTTDSSPLLLEDDLQQFTEKSSEVASETIFKGIQLPEDISKDVDLSLIHI